MDYVGKSAIRIDAVSKVKGEALYPGDFNLPDQAHIKILFTSQPHAIVRSVNTRAAEIIPGVIAVLTAKDVPVNEYGLLVPDQPVLCGPGSNKLYADRVRCISDQIAIVIAETEEIATKARDAIVVDYEDLPVITDVYEAIRSDSYRIHPDRDSNVFGRYRVRKGDIEEGFKQADVIVEGNYQTPVQEHAYLQPEAGVSYIDEQGRVTVVVAGQWTHEDQLQIAHSLNLPPDRVRVIYPAIGGAFGGREDMSIQIVLALAAWTLYQRGINRPVKIIWSREESFIGHHKRHPCFIHTRWGATREGKIVAAEVELIADGGAYVYTSTKVLGNATLMCTGPYEIPNVKVDSHVVFTSNIPNGAFRGYGGPQGAFAAESQMNKLAVALNMNPVELRLKNLLQEGSLLSVGTPLPKGVSIREVVKACAESSSWRFEDGKWVKPTTHESDEANPYLKKGFGFACAFKNVGFSFGAPEQCTAKVELYGQEKIDKAILYHSGAEVGQGAHTVFVQMAAEALRLPLERVQLVASDTAFTENSGSVSASRMTFMAGNAIRGAAQLALEKWAAEERPAVGLYQYRPPRTTPLDPETGKSEPNFAYGYVAEAAEVEVDIETGEVRIVNIICADDVGKAVNPQQVQGQVEGGVIQAAGYTLMENFIQKDGELLTRGLSTYLIPTVLDIPDQVNSIVLEYPDPIGPFGARGMGEMPNLPLAPAVTAAVFDAVGIWYDEFPLTSERVFNGVRKSGFII